MAPRAEMPPHDVDASQQDAAIQQVEMSIEDTIGFLIASMQDHSSDASHLVSVVRALIDFADDHPAAVLASSVIDQVFSIMAHHNRHERLLSLSFRFLWGLQTTDVEGRNYEDAAAMIEPQHISFLVSIMDAFPDNEEIQRFGALMFYVMTAGGTTLDPFIDTNAVSATLTAGRNFESDTVLFDSICSYITIVLDKDIDGRFKDEINAAGGIFILVEFLKRHGTSHHADGSALAATFPMICESIKVIGEGNENAISTFVEQGGINAILSTMTYQTANSRLQVEASNCLHVLASESHDVKEAFVAAGGIHKLSGLLRRHSDDEMMCGGVSILFASLALYDDDFVVALTLEGGLAAIISSMHHYVNIEELQDMSVTTLLDAVSSNDTKLVKDEIESIPNVVRSVVTALNVHSNSEGLQVLGCSVLKELAFSMKMCHDIVRSGGLILLLKAMKQFSENEEIQEAGVLTIGRFVEVSRDKYSEETFAKKKAGKEVSIDLVESIYSIGFVPVILDILRRLNANDELLHSTISCLHVLAESSKGVKQQIVSSGGIPLLRSFREKNNGSATKEATLLLHCLDDGENNSPAKASSKPTGSY